ncbi:MAG: glycosyl hydrolase [Phycisphaerae bacterium]
MEMKQNAGTGLKRILATSASIIYLLMCVANAASLKSDFQSPPDSARPGVYWYFMDGNLDREEMTADLESMKDVGLGNLIFLEVNVGVPRGPVDFMSDHWQDLFAHAVREAQRLGIDITLGSGPGWTGSGGPWVKPEQAMQHLLSSSTVVKGPQQFDSVLPVPQQHPTPWGNMQTDFYEDVAVFAFPQSEPVIADIAEKALYDRYPYTSHAGVKEFLPVPAEYDEPNPENIISPETIIDLSEYLASDGRLRWDVPAGNWTIIRFVRRATCANTRPAPAPGVGLECDKFDSAALDWHIQNYYGKLIEKTGPRKGAHGWTAVHIDSWEMGSQNWTPNFLAEFKARRGYDALPYLPVYSGRAVGSLEESERFLFDVRLTSQELVLENHAGHLKEFGRENGFELSIEPYDMNPTADLDLGAVADVPMCEFWSEGMGFNSFFSCVESTSIAHTMGRPIVAAEAFTANPPEGWRQYPWSMKNQGDWAFCMGINRFVYHTFAHKPLGSDYRPGMTMGPYGVHWDRGQTWWPMAKDYHEYISRCSHLLRQGVTVSDILYLTPEGAPHVFRAPASALEGSEPLADKKGYGFDGCSPEILAERAAVRHGKIAFPGGTSYSLMVMPNTDVMTPALLEKIESLVKSGAVVVGSPPKKSPSLSGYPECDDKVLKLAKRMWGGLKAPAEITKRKYGRGAIYWGGAFSPATAEAQQPIIAGAGWIWYPEGNPRQAAPVEPRYFKRTIYVDPQKKLLSARAEITADNEFALYINGRKAIQGDSFRVIGRKQILSSLHAGENVITVVAGNGGQDANPAGLIAAFELTYKDETRDIIYTDESWHAGIEEYPRWQTAAEVPSDWKPATVLADFSASPWGLSAEMPASELYPDYDETAALLREMGVSEDFSTTGPVRYGHRTTDSREIYFVSNKSAEAVEADCTFRVEGLKPELWNPVTGQTRSLPIYEAENGLTTLPLQFEAYESYFVIFPRKESFLAAEKSGEANFPQARILSELRGSWRVSFEPLRGGPEEDVAFDSLLDWTKSDVPAIKYYSGIATYRKTFNFTEEVASGEKIYLNLGTVHDMARVRLNDVDLGVVWCAPWQVEITEALKTGSNKLSIEIANRWGNRLIGDQQPENKDVRQVKWDSGLLEGRTYSAGRYTFTTYSVYRADSPLTPSGLLGPVRILCER